MGETYRGYYLHRGPSGQIVVSKDDVFVHWARSEEDAKSKVDELLAEPTVSTQFVLVSEKGQGLVEYTLIVVLVALVFWVGIKNTNIGSALEQGWSKVTVCVGAPSACTEAS